MNASSDESATPRAGVQGGGAASATTLQVPLLRTVGLQKTFGTRTVLHPFTLEIMSGEIRALLGQNGSGKSTLIKILSGFHTPDDGGQCLIRAEQLEFGKPTSSARLGLRFVHQDLGLIGEASVLDNLAFTRGYDTRFGTIQGKLVRSRAVEALAMVGLDISPKASVASLSPSQRTGVAVARAVYQDEAEAAVVVLDEPSATLPTREVSDLHAMIRSIAAHGIGILYVTHHLDEVFRLASTVSVLRDGHLVESCSVADIDHSTLVHRLVGSELESVQRKRTSVGDRAVPSTTFRIGDLQTDHIHGVSLEAMSGEIVGIYGLTGSGRESILGTAFGGLPRVSGSIEVNGKDLGEFSPAKSIAAGIGYLPPDRKTSGGFMDLDATENLTMVDVSPFWRKGFLRGKLENAEASRWFDRLGVSPRDGIKQVLASFSGGNQQKIVLGKWLRVTPRVLLLDEPTQGVDVGAKAQVHRIIIEAAEEGAAVVVSSTDVEELASLCDRVVILSSGKVAALLEGDDVNESHINRQLASATTSLAKE